MAPLHKRCLPPLLKQNHNRFKLSQIFGPGKDLKQVGSGIL